MILWLSISIIVFCVLHGVCEGMIMTQFSDPRYIGYEDKNIEGVRCHAWFPAYHWLVIARFAAFGTVVVCLVHYHLCYISKMITLTGVCIIGWELVEQVYNWARYKVLVIEHENVMGIWNLNGWPVWLLHSGRWILGLALVITGGLL